LENGDLASCVDQRLETWIRIIPEGQELFVRLPGSVIASGQPL